MYRKHIGLSLLLIFVAASLLGLSGALLSRMAEAQGCASPNWEGKFYSNVDFTGSVANTVCSAVIDFDWGGGAPVAGVGLDNFSVRWTSTQSFPTAGNYLFTVTVEDGVRLYANGTPLINAMSDSQSPRTLTAVYTVATPGSTAFLTLEMVNYTGNAQLKLVWALTSGGAANTTTTTTTTGGAPPPPSGQNQVSVLNATPTVDNGGGHPWNIQYFDNPNLEGAPIANAEAPADGISRNYGVDVPAPGLPADYWSARWTRPVTFPEGVYTFTLRADDAARVTIDGVEILNQINFAQGTTFTVNVRIPAGQHQIVVEHKEEIEFANLFLTWDPPIGTTLLPDGCNGETAGVNGSAAPCPGRSATLTLAATATPQPITLSVTVRAGPLNFRPQPSKESGRISFLHRGEQYTAIGRSRDNIWLQLQVGNETGWAMVEFLTPQGDINMLPITDGTAQTAAPAVALTPTSTGVAVVAPRATPTPNIPNVQARALGNMRLREGPGNSFDRIASIPWGAVVKVIGLSSDRKWIQIDFNGMQGWSSRDWYEVIEGDIDALPITG